MTIPLLIQVTPRNWFSPVATQREREKKIFFLNCFSAPEKAHHSSSSRYLHIGPAVPPWAIYSLRALAPLEEVSFFTCALHPWHLWALKNLFHGYWKSSSNSEKWNSSFENSLTEQVHARALHSSASWAQHPWEGAPLLSPVQCLE